MWCLELQIPPLPQLIKIDRAVWEPGMQHFERTFNVYDVLYVRSGVFYITEEQVQYSVQPGELLTLEPGKKHWGHRPVEEKTEIYWLHFVHPYESRMVESDKVPWSSPIRRGTDLDVAPPEQFMYLPKYASIEPTLLVPLLDELLELGRSLELRDALQLQVKAGALFVHLQAAAGTNVRSRAWMLSERAIRYLQVNVHRTFNSHEMESALHYQIDYVTRCMKQYTGMTPLQYLHHLQVEQAKSLLKHTDLPVREIAEQVGQPNANYFIRLFRRAVGQSPGSYRMEKRKTLG